jgi:glycosyltransferase involved in cell wall biosynthesis
MNAPLVSVLIPVFNVERYLAAALDSMLRQTYPQLEFIIINDGSTDRTAAILSEYQSVDARVRVLHNETNVGIVGSLNRGLDAAAGAYIARMDGDDVSEPDRIERQMRYLEQHPDIALVGVGLQSIDGDGRPIARSPIISDWQIAWDKLQFGPPVSHVWVCRKSLYAEIGKYRNIPGCEDYDFLLRLRSANKRFTNIPDYYGYHVRVGRPGNTVSSLGLGARLAKSYAYRLYCQRLANRSDDYDDARCHQALSHGKLRAGAYSVSTFFLRWAVVNRSRRFLSMLSIACCCIAYPPQTMYLYERFRMKRDQ